MPKKEQIIQIERRVEMENDFFLGKSLIWRRDHLELSEISEYCFKSFKTSQSKKWRRGKNWRGIKDTIMDGWGH